jgi:hypothetical protein
MKMNYKTVPTRFGPETRFELRPGPPAPFRVTEENELERLKSRLLASRVRELSNPLHNAYARRAANEASALAWVTPYPLLVFPALFDEKLTLALLQAERQTAIRQRSLELLAV